MAHIRLVAICGSASVGSANAAALGVASDHLIDLMERPPQATVDLGAIPPFRANQVDDPPDEVAELRSDLERADGLLLAAPEYAAGLAGTTKNALDWLVGSASLYHKPVAVLSAGSTGGPFAIEQLVRTLSWQGALVVATLGIAAPATKTDNEGHYQDRSTIEEIGHWVTTLVTAVRESPPERLERVGTVVRRYGIDPARFGTLD